MTTGALVQLHDDLWVVRRPLRFFGMELGARMTVVRAGGDLILHSPVAPDDALRGELESLGRVRWVIGPNTFHHLYLGPWIDAGAEGHAVGGLHRKRKDLAFAGTIGPEGPWGDALVAHPCQGIPFTDEAVFLHRPSRTLIVSDLVFNLPADAPWATRAMMWAGGGYPGCRCTALERLLFHREPGKRDLERILSWDFDRVVLAHGDVVEQGGKEALRAAYAWLLG